MKGEHQSTDEVKRDESRGPTHRGEGWEVNHPPSPLVEKQSFKPEEECER